MNNIKRILREDLNDHIVYHGTNSDFLTLDPSKISGGSRGIYGWGFYFSSSIWKAKDYGKNIYQLDISGFNILELDEPLNDDLLNKIKKLSFEETDMILSAFYDVIYNNLQEKRSSNTLDATIKTVKDMFRWDISKHLANMFVKIGYDMLKYGYEYVLINLEKANGKIKPFVNENKDLAIKKYLKTNKLTQDEMDFVLSITNGDNFTSLVAAEAAHIKLFNTDIKKDRIILENLYRLVKGYNKNIFPIDDDLFSFSEDAENSKHIITLYEALNEREFLVKAFNKLPSFAIRNLKKLSQTPTNTEHAKYIFKQYRIKINILIDGAERLTNFGKENYLTKVFNSRHTLDQMVDVMENFISNLTYRDDLTRNEIIGIAKIHKCRVLFDKNDLVVLHVKTHEAMQAIGCNSMWCFSRPHSLAYWLDYGNNGVLAIFDLSLESDDSRSLSIILMDSGQAYDHNNEPIEDNDYGGDYYKNLIDRGFNYLKYVHVYENKIINGLRKLIK